MLKKLATIACALAAVALVATTLFMRGHPLGYRGALAVVHQVVGGCELRIMSDRPIRATTGMAIGHGSELRTSPFSSVLLVTPGGRIDMLDGTTLRTLHENDKPFPIWRLFNGRVRVAVDGEHSMTMSSAATDTYLELMPGSYTLTADGKGLLAGYCREGTMRLHEGEGRPVEVKPGQMFTVTPLSPAFISNNLPELEVRARINPRSKPGELNTITGNVPTGGRVYINGELTYPDATGEFTAALAPGAKEVVLLAEDIQGNAARKVLQLR